MRAPFVSLCLIWTCGSPLAAQGSLPAPARPRTTPEVWHPTLEAYTPPGSIQIEFGSTLSAAGYQKLRSVLHWTPRSERADYYFDAYDGHQFLLRTGGTPLKVRIKVKKEKLQWQVSRFVAKDQVRVGDLRIKVHTTESWDGRLEGRHAAALVEASDAFASHLADGGAALRADADRVEAAWLKLRAKTPPPGLMVIDRTLAGTAYRFYPRKVTPDKVRLSVMLPGFTSPAVRLLLGSEPEVDASGHPVQTYELEAEADGPITAPQARAIALGIGRLLQRAGLSARDQQEVPSMSNEYTLRQLSR